MAKAGETTSAKTPRTRKSPAAAKKKAPEPTSRKELALAALNKVKARHPGKIFLGNEFTSPWMLKRLPTGLLGLDLALNGGLPAGGFTMIYGRDGVGKNWLANQVIAFQQQLLGDECNIAVCCTEMPYDKDFGHKCGVSVGMSDAEIRALDDQLFFKHGAHLSEEDIAHRKSQIGNFVIVPPSTAEAVLDIAIDLIESRSFDLVLIDSFGSLLTEGDAEKSLEDEVRVGGASKLNTSFSRKMNTATAPDANGNPNMTCIIGTNQIRDNMNRSNPNSPHTKEGGGWALKHARWVGIEMKKIAKAKRGDNIVGKVVQWEVTKQKAGGHEGAVGNFDFLWDMTGFNRYLESLKVAVDLGIVQKSGSWFSYKGEQLEQGLQKAAGALAKRKLLSEIEEAVFSEAGVNYSYAYARASAGLNGED